MDDSTVQSTLLVFGLIFYLFSAYAFEALRARLATIPSEAAALAQQTAVLGAEVASSRLDRLRAEEAHEKLRQEIERATTGLLEAKQTLHELQHRLPAVVYVLDQIIQNSYASWVLTVRWDMPPKGVAGPVAAELRRGRRVLVFADNPANVRRRIEARFPAGQGYHTGEPAPFEI
jgi:hypothetical protein